MRLLLFALLCLLPASALTAFADTPPATSLRPDVLYTHKGEFIQVKPMRPLTLNAHVEQFAYDPLGIEIAYVGSEPQGDNTLHFVKTVDARTGHEISHFSYTEPSESQNTALMLRGWSTSGKFLMLQRFSPDPSEPQTSVSEFLRWDLSTSPPAMKTINPQEALPLEQQSADLTGSADCYPSPTGRWLVFTQSVHTLKENGKPLDQNAYVLYDPERDTFKLLALPPNTGSYSWSDAGHLKIWQAHDQKQFDVVTGQISPIPAADSTDKTAVSKQYPDLSLDTQNPKQQDAQGSDGYLNSYLIWIRRAPFGGKPMGAAAAGLMPAQANNFQTTWSPTDPQAVWSPTGRQVAFVANDDLCVTDLVSASGAMPREKVAVGLPLDCDDERVLASANLKEIGLGLIQFIQDNDENYPASGDFMAKVYPYIKTMDVFSVDGHPFVYEQPADLSLAKMDSPATTENGYLNLPCARVVLFADGHVRVFPKQEPSPQQVERM